MGKEIKREITLAVLLMFGCSSSQAIPGTSTPDRFIANVAADPSVQNIADIVSWLRSNEGDVRFLEVEGAPGAAGYWQRGGCSINFDSQRNAATLLVASCSTPSQAEAEQTFDLWRDMIRSSSVSGRIETEVSVSDAGVIREVRFDKTSDAWAYDADVRILKVDDYYEVHARFARDLPLLVVY